MLKRAFIGVNEDVNEDVDEGWEDGLGGSDAVEEGLVDAVGCEDGWGEVCQGFHCVEEEGDVLEERDVLGLQGRGDR